MHRELGGEGEDGLVVVIELLDLDFGGEAHVEFVVNVVDDVRAPVAEHAHAVFVKATPIEGMVKGVERELLAGSAPEVPVFEGGGDWVFRKREFAGAILLFHEPEAGSFPGVELREVIAEAELDHLGKGVDALSGMTLITHLGDDSELLFGAHEDFRFLKGAGEGFLDVDVLAEGHGLDGCGEVCVVWCADAYGIDVLTHLIEHLAEVVEAFRIGVGFEVLFGVFGEFEIDITEGDGGSDASLAKRRNNSAGSATDADAAEVDPLARRKFGVGLSAGAGEVGWNEGKPEDGSGGSFKEVAAGRGGLILHRAFRHFGKCCSQYEVLEQ